jgi:hypothetical protein
MKFNYSCAGWSGDLDEPTRIQDKHEHCKNEQEDEYDRREHHKEQGP